MPTTLATRWRQRDIAIARKTSQLFEPWEDEAGDMTPEPHKPTVQPSSPISVASVLDAEPKPLEIKPLILPGAWVIVGKHGRPTLSATAKMYDEPQTTTTKKKKKKTKKAPIDEAAPLVVTLEEAPSSSKCLRALDRSTAQRDKAVTSAKEAKHWATYRLAKQLQREALRDLAALAPADSDQTEVAAPAPAKKPTKENKANTNKDKARRRARSAAAAMRCLMPDEGECALAVERVKEAPRPALELSKQLLMVASATALPGAWQTVGKRGKVLSDFPPLQASDKDDTRMPRKAARPPKRVSSPKAKGSLWAESHEESPAKAVKRDSAKRDKTLQCSVM